MRRFGKTLGRILLGLCVALALIWFFWPREPVDADISFDHRILPDNLEVYLAKTEERFDDITPGVEKRIIWAGAPHQQTDLAVVYIHGFSATSEEIRPVPDLVAEAFGANLFFTRLTGHGRGSLAMAEPVAGDWLEDTAEALAIGRKIGREVVVIATSTGGTAIAITATRPELMERVKALVLVSPNFRVRNPTSVVLEWPLARSWGAVVAGAERSFDPLNEGHSTYWTTIYPTTALIPMSALVKYARDLDYSGVTVPSLFMFSDEDAVVSAETTRAVSTKWGSEVTLMARDLGEGDDPFNHIIAGDILSPGQTEPVANAIINWIKERP
jgi:pimeloyl-ACP methyl ester carboxylesterase